MNCSRYSKSDKDFVVQSFHNCNTTDNRTGGYLTGPARKAAILHNCCEQVDCDDPWTLGLPCPKPSPNPMPGPHFGVSRAVGLPETDHAGMGVL